MSRVRLHRTEAIVLKRQDYGEADRILTLLTPDRGKLSAIAKGVRRIASRKAGHVEPFVHATVLLAEGRNLDVLTQVDTIAPFRSVREDLVRTTYAYHMAELVDRFLGEGVPAAGTFELLRACLEALGDAGDPSLLARYFEVRLLAQLGYRPELFRCARCARDLRPEGNGFSPDAGGVVCPACLPAQPDALSLDERAFRVLRYLQTREWAAADGIDVAPTTRSALERVMLAYIRHLLERDLRSVEFLHGLRRVARSNDIAPSGRERAPEAIPGDDGGRVPGQDTKGPP